MRGLDPFLRRHHYPFLRVTSDFLSTFHLLKNPFFFAIFFSVWWSGIDPLHLADPRSYSSQVAIFFWLFLAIVPLIVAVVNKSHSCHFPPLTSALGREKRKEKRKLLKGECHFHTFFWWSENLLKCCSWQDGFNCNSSLPSDLSQSQDLTTTEGLCLKPSHSSNYISYSHKFLFL